jgi:hypothetical protein
MYLDREENGLGWLPAIATKSRIPTEILLNFGFPRDIAEKRGLSLLYREVEFRL